MSVLGNPKTGSPKDVTQQDPTQRQRTCLIGICKDMMSSMDPLRDFRRLFLSLASSILASFAGKDYTNFRRARARTPNASHSFRMLVLLPKVSHPPFIATRDLTGGQPVMIQ